MLCRCKGLGYIRSSRSVVGVQMLLWRACVVRRAVMRVWCNNPIYVWVQRLSDFSAMQVSNGRFSCVVNRKSLCKAVVTVLRKAQTEKRLTCGLIPAIKLLEVDPERALFCIMPQSSQGNAALHIQSVLLQAFCNENDIHIIQVHISFSV